MLPFHPGLDRRPDSIPKLCTVIIIVYGHLSINFLLHYIERTFVFIIMPEDDLVKSPTESSVIQPVIRYRRSYTKKSPGAESAGRRFYISQQRRAAGRSDEHA